MENQAPKPQFGIVAKWEEDLVSNAKSLSLFLNILCKKKIVYIILICILQNAREVSLRVYFGNLRDLGNGTVQTNREHSTFYDSIPQLLLQAVELMKFLLLNKSAYCMLLQGLRTFRWHRRVRRVSS